MATANTIDSEILKNRPSKLMVEAFLKYGQKSPFTKNVTSDYEVRVSHLFSKDLNVALIVGFVR